MVLAAPFTFSWSAVAVMALLWWVSGSVGIGFTYHRSGSSTWARCAGCS
jgi:fatty-acid desaturase